MLFPQTKVKIYVVHKISDLKEPGGSSFVQDKD